VQGTSTFAGAAGSSGSRFYRVVETPSRRLELDDSTNAARVRIQINKTNNNVFITE